MNMPVYNRFDGYFESTTAQRVQKIREGNGLEVPRDLGMRKREYFETRPFPAKPHHWLASEFEQFLLTHKYPPNTIRDRMRGHGLMIREALVKGEPVPEIVLKSEEGISAVQDAIMEVSSTDYCVFLEAQTSHFRGLFQNAVMKRCAEISDPTDDALLKEIFLLGVKAAAEQEMSGFSPYFTVSWLDRPLRILQSDNGNYFQFQDAGWNQGALSGIVHVVDRARAEEWVSTAMAQGELKYDDMLWMMRDHNHSDRQYVPARMSMRSFG